MKALIVVLIVAAFLQTTVLPIDLVLLILICRAYLKSGRENIYLASAFGFLVAHLNLTNLGLTAFFYLVIVQITQVISRRSFFNHPLVIIPVSFILLSFSHITNFLLNSQTIEPPKILLAALLSLPVFYLMKFWEERFVVRKEIKLRI